MFEYNSKKIKYKIENPKYFWKFERKIDMHRKENDTKVQFTVTGWTKLE